MKIATTIGEMYKFGFSPVEAVRFYEGTGFRYLDYNFYSVHTDPSNPLLSDRWQEGILESKAVAEQLGFQFVQAHAPACDIRGEHAEFGLFATIRTIEACGLLGIKNMVIHPGFFPEIKYPDDQFAYFKENESFFRSLIPAMEKNEVNILFENGTILHCPNGCYYPILGEDLNALLDYMDHPLFGAAWDVGHAHMDSLDHYSQIMALGKNLKAIHVHDNDRTSDWHAAPFFGTVDYDSLMKGLIESGYEGCFTLESDNFFACNRGTLSGPLSHTPLEVKKAALSLQYTAAKSILTAYGLYEV